jgi:hypothetical protein
MVALRTIRTAHTPTAEKMDYKPKIAMIEEEDSYNLEAVDQTRAVI